METRARTANRLSKEKSPYLLQHQYNPVDWYPWGEEAIKKAREENKPIFLSVGYSTCHWCHVMEHTSFEVDEVAQIMNKHFINIKVDREERPDVDKVYMNFVIMSTGSGGWPMSVFLEPQSLSPFFGGTYFSPHGDRRRPGFIQIMETIAEQWHRHPEKIISSGLGIAEHLKNPTDSKIEDGNRSSFLSKVGGQLMVCSQQRIKSFDPKYGGWGDAPKFPQPVILASLFASHALSGKSKSIYLDQIEQTLTNMAKGGIHDHLGGGFHRYSVTEDWKLPHFEKMLYDQSQIAIAYINAYQITKRDLYRNTVIDIFDYVQRQLTSKENGGFFSAEDADSPIKENPAEKREGAFYVWSYDEIEQIFKDYKPKESFNGQEITGEELFKVAQKLYNIQRTGNVPSAYDPHGELDNMNILHTAASIDSVSIGTGFSNEKIEAIIRLIHSILAQVQMERPRPHLDDKCVTVWNAMMISALCKGYQVLKDEKYLKMALNSLNFIKQNLIVTSNTENELGDDFKLLRSYREGPSSIEAFADDYASLIAALIDLYETTFDIAHLKMALKLQKKMDQLFWDTEKGGYFVDSGNPELHLLTRTKEDYDGSEPSYNSVAAHSLVRLANILHDKALKSRCEDLLTAFGHHLMHVPLGLPFMTYAAALYDQPPKVILIYGALDNPKTRELIDVVHSNYDPYRVVLQASFMSQSAEYFNQMGLDMFYDLKKNLSTDDNPCVFICQDYACQLPITDPVELQNQLSQAIPSH